MTNRADIVKCSRCNKFKPETEFELNNKQERKKGCVACLAKVKIINKKTYDNGGLVRWRSARKLYTINNQEQVAETQHKYYHNNSDARKQSSMEWAKNNKDKTRFNKIISSCKSQDMLKDRYDCNNHVDKGYIKQLIYDQDLKCIYCSVEMSFECDNRADNLLTPERIDNDLGHIKSNVVLACFKCNVSRSDRHTYEEYKQIVLNRTRIPVND